jgi:hypothetical protein
MVIKASRLGYEAQARQDKLQATSATMTPAFHQEWHRLRDATRTALQTSAKLEANNPEEMLAKARLLAAVIYREGRDDYRFALALSLLHDMGEKEFADRRDAVEAEARGCPTLTS